MVNPIQRARRSTRVLALAARTFVGYRRTSWRNRRLPADEAQRRLSAYHRKSAERFYETATDLQGLLIKTGQVIGARADLFPDEYVEVLSRLHDAVPPRPYEPIRALIEAELGQPIDEVFSEFERVPIASASLAQVHRARLRDGREAAVKVQYPGIEDVVRVDLQNIRLLVRFANRVLRDFDFTPIVDELVENIPHELDFIHEGHNAEATARNFAEQPEIVVPEIYWQYTTRRVLVMEYIEGIKITDLAAMDAAGIDRQAVAQLLVESYARQIFAHGFFHADPHPGNLFVQPGPKLVILDYGLAKQLSPQFLRDFVRLMGAMIVGDREGLAAAFRALGFRTRHEDDAAFEALGEALVTRMSRNQEFNRDRSMVSQFQQRLMRLLRENPIVKVPGEFLLIGRVMGLLSGLGTQLGSQVNLLEVLSREVAASPALRTAPAD
jgi:aarF domain-containing kinase